MKKLLILSILVLGLASCGEKKVDITPKDEKIKIGLICTLSSTQFNYQHFFA